MATVLGATEAMFAKTNAFAAARGTLNKYEYLNYSYKTQMPIQGYGADNVARLKAASRMYDPAQIFQKFVPGGFKLS